ncbi:hypothetical protein F5884DRAFT_778607 [Xylogone sp. PMI_703]|nr:hypothetical protein F5884DRAFT_778607 [Xylogone sp. PMI_703]
MDIEYFLDQYDTEKGRINAALPKIWSYSRHDPLPTAPDIPLSVATTWELSLQTLSRDTSLKDSKIQLLMLSGFLGKAVISESIFQAYFQQSQNRPDWTNAFTVENSSQFDVYLFRETLAEMGRLCLLKAYNIDKNGITWSLHPLIQDWAQYRHSREECQNFTILALDIIQYSLDSYGSDWPTLRTDSLNHHLLRPHVEACYSNCQNYLTEAYSLGNPDTATPALKIANFFASDNRFDIAEKLQQQVANLSPTGSMRNFSALRQLAQTFHAKREFEAAAVIRDTLRRQVLFDTDSIEEALLLLEQAMTYRSQANESKTKDDSETKIMASLDLGNQSIQIIERLKGRKSLEYGSAIARLATIYYHAGNLKEARTLGEEAVTTIRQALGENDLKTIEVRHQLAVTLAKMGETAKAISIHQEVWDARSRALGQYHNDTLSAQLFVARALRLDGQLEKANDMHNDVLAKAEAANGPGHNDTKKAARRLWRCLIARECFEEAESLLDKYKIQLTQKEEEALVEALRKLELSKVKSVT